MSASDVMTMTTTDARRTGGLGDAAAAGAWPEVDGESWTDVLRAIASRKRRQELAHAAG
jgi:hypothetical protein